VNDSPLLRQKLRFSGTIPISSHAVFRKARIPVIFRHLHRPLTPFKANQISSPRKTSIGSGNNSGEVETFLSLDVLKVKGSIIGKKDIAADNGSQIRVGGDPGFMKVGGDIIATGAAGYGQAQISSGGTIGVAKIGGSLRGGANGFQGSISGEDGIGAISIGGDLEGDNFSAGTLSSSGGTIGSVTIAGSMNGGSIRAVGLGTVAVTGDLLGRSANTGGITTTGNATVTSISIGGSVVGGSGFNSGGIQIDTDSTLLSLTIGGDLRSTVGLSGFAGAGTLTNVFIGGSVFANERRRRDQGDNQRPHGARHFVQRGC